MYRLVVVAVMIAAALHASKAESEVPQCTQESKPCRMREVERRSKEIDRSKHFCNCPGSVDCSDTWDDPNRVVSLRETRFLYEVDYQMKFCQTFKPVPECTNDTYTVTLEGFSPPALVERNCHCPAGQLLRIASYWRVPKAGKWGTIYDSYRSFKCEEYLSDCEEKQQCKVKNSDRDDYLCTCPYWENCALDIFCKPMFGF